jgi:hypothetical protein
MTFSVYNMGFAAMAGADEHATGYVHLSATVQA